MKKLFILCLLCLAGCTKYSSEEKAIIKYVEANANDPDSYEPISFRFIGPATFDNTWISKGNDTRLGDLYEHTYRAKNGFGALTMHTDVFSVLGGTAEPLADSLAEKAIINFRP